MKHVDSAIISLLSLDPTRTKVRRGGSGSSSASTFRVTSVCDDGKVKEFFVKTAPGKTGDTMFAGEHASLNALASAVPGLAPRSHGYGRLADEAGSFLVTDYIDMSAGHSTQSTKQSLAQKLARLHTTAAPVPDGHAKSQFGFPVPTCCGDTVQRNEYKAPGLTSLPIIDYASSPSKASPIRDLMQSYKRRLSRSARWSYLSCWQTTT